MPLYCRCLLLGHAQCSESSQVSYFQHNRAIHFLSHDTQRFPLRGALPAKLPTIRPRQSCQSSAARTSASTLSTHKIRPAGHITHDYHDVCQSVAAVLCAPVRLRTYLAVVRSARVGSCKFGRDSTRTAPSRSISQQAWYVVSAQAVSVGVGLLCALRLRGVCPACAG